MNDDSEITPSDESPIRALAREALELVGQKCVRSLRSKKGKVTILEALAFIRVASTSPVSLNADSQIDNSVVQLRALTANNRDDDADARSAG